MPMSEKRISGAMPDRPESSASAFFTACSCEAFAPSALVTLLAERLAVADAEELGDFDAAAELGDAAPGLVDLFVGKRALHGEEDAADLRVRQTQLREHVQPRHGA